MIVVRIDDREVIDSVFKHPEVEDMLFDDSPKDVSYPINDNVLYLAAYESIGGPIGGIGMFIRKNMIELDCHCGFMPDFRGAMAVDAGMIMNSWIRKYTKFRKLVACIPTVNKQCQRFVVAIGCKREGVNANSFLKNGVIYDQVYYGLEV